MAFRKIEAGLVHGSVDNYIGKKGTIFYDNDDGSLRLSDGTTPGGNALSSGGGSSYTLPTATTTIKGGVKIDGTSIAIDNGVISVGTVPYANISNAPSVPTKVSDLTNDTGFITGVSWTQVTSKPTLFSGAYADLSGKPTTVSTFTNDAGYLTSSSLSGYATESYVTGRGYITSASLPTTTSDLTNDSGYLTEDNFDLNTIDYDSNSKLHATGILPGDAEGFTAIFAGRAAGISALPNTVIQSQAQVNDYAQNNFQNTDDGNHASTEWVATSPNGDDSNYYIDLGINGASWDGTAENSLYDNVGQRDGWLYVQGGNAGGGNLVLGTSLANTYTKIISGDASAGDTEVARFSSTEIKLEKQLTFSDNTTQTTAWTGAVSYNDLTDTPSLFSGSYNDLTDTPALVTSYNQLTDRPTLFSGSYNDLTSKPTLFSGSYNDLTDVPSAPVIALGDLTDVDLTTPPTIGQVLKYDGTKWAPGTDITAGGSGTDADTLDGFDSSYFLNYNNLTNKPTIPTTVTVNGTAITLGSSGTVTANTTNALTIGTGLTGTASTFDGSAANTIKLDTTFSSITASNGTTTTLSAGSLYRNYTITSVSGTHTIALPSLTTLVVGQQITFYLPIAASGIYKFTLSDGTTTILQNNQSLIRAVTFTVLSTATNVVANWDYKFAWSLTASGTGSGFLTTAGGNATTLYVTTSIDTGGGGTIALFASSATINLAATSNTLSHTLNIATAASAATYTKTVNIGTNLGGGTSTINIGTGVTSGTANLNIGSTSSTVQVNGTTTITSLTATNSIVGSITGNAATATKLGTARAINGVNFDGSAAITVTASTTNALTIGSGLSGTSFDGGTAVTIAVDSTVALRADTHYIGTTSIALNRTSGSQTLTGVSIDGNAATVTNGVYTSGSYSDPSWITSLDYSKLTGTPTLFSGSYTDLTSKPTIYSSAYIGTTSLDFTRSSASQTLTGVSIDGNAATVTNGVYTTGSYANPAWITSLAYSKLTGTPTVPTNVSQLTNDSGYATLTGVETLTNKTLTLPTIGGTGATFNGSSSGTTVLKASSTAGTTTITLPATTGTVVTTGDSGTVTNTMLAGSIANAKLANSTATIGSSLITLGATVSNLEGLNLVTSTSFSGALLGNASTATKLATARNINGTAFDGSAAITITANTTNALTIGTGLSGTSFNGSGAVTIAIDSTVATLTGSQTLTNKTLTLPTIGGTGATFNGSTSGTTVLKATAAAGSTTLTLPAATDTLVGKATTDTLTNKSISGSTNTLTNIPNSALTNSSVTVNGSAISLGGSATITVNSISASGFSTSLGFDSGGNLILSNGTYFRAPNGLSIQTGGPSFKNWAFDTSGNITFPDSTVQSTAYTGNAATVTNGVYTTDTGTVTNTMLAGSIANAKLSNSSVTVNGTSISLGSSATIKASTTNALTIGSGLTGTSFDGGTAVTIAVDTSTVALKTSITYIGTTSLSLNRASANMALTGILSIDGSAATAGTVTTAAQPAITSVGTLSSLTVSGTINAGTSTWTKTAGNGDIAFDNASTDTPASLFYYANNKNWGIDSNNQTFGILSGQILRFVTDLNESGGAVKAAIDTTGNIYATGFIQAGAYRAGQVIKDTMLDNSQFTVNATTVATSTSDTDFITYSYTPVSASSYLVIHVHVGRYDAATGTGAGSDSYFSRIKVGGNEIVYGRQATVTSNSFRTGALFPLTGRYTNSDVTAKTITVGVRRDVADDSMTIDNSATALWLRITEIAR